MQKIRSQKRIATSHRRSGLAPLELVMLTPFLVLMGALMICFGDAALWKIRAQATVHYSGTQTESYRGAHFDASSGMNPRPANWPRPASMGGRGEANINDVQDLYWNQIGPEDTAALQGNSGGGSSTTLSDRYVGNQFSVNRTMIADRGVHAGTAAVTRKFPMLTRLLPADGQYRVDLQSESLTGDWYFNNVGLGSNSQRRADHLYEMDPNELRGLDGLWSDFLTAFRGLSGVPYAIDYLDRDNEIYIYQPGRARPIDFHPSRPRGCELDLVTYSTSSQFQSHIQRIRGVPRRMATTWRGVYQAELNYRQDPTYIPKGPHSDEELRRRITTLQEYLQRLTMAGF